jgi:membrane-associated phospholipid phosphatase
MLVCGLIFTTDLLLVRSNRFFGLEVVIRDRVAATFRSALPVDLLPFLNTFSLIGVSAHPHTAGIVVLGLTVGAAVLALFYRRRPWSATALVLAVGGAAVLSSLLKDAIVRPLLDSQSGHTFPSGHACVSFVFFAMLAYLWCLLTNEGNLRAAGLLGCLVLGTLVGLSTLTLHYVSEVVGGYALGGAWLAFILMCCGERMQREACSDRLAS